jgi:hypothetical protein
MDADGGINAVVFTGNRDPAGKLAIRWVASRDVEHELHARIERPLHDPIAIGIEFRAVEVAMRIDEDHLF